MDTYTPAELAALDPVAISGASPRHIQSVLEKLIATANRGAQETATAWGVCASVHEKWARGKDPLYKTRQADFLKHASLTWIGNDPAPPVNMCRQCFKGFEAARKTCPYCDALAGGRA